jgi:hypothetical protein
MTMLHEIMAHATGMDMGPYYVVTNNAHVYESQHGELLQQFHEPQRIQLEPDPLLEPQESWQDFCRDCQDFCRGDLDKLRTVWMSCTARPLYQTYLKKEAATVHKIKCPQWRVAAVQWLHWNRR